MVALTVGEAEASWQMTSQRELSRQQLRSMRVSEMILAFATIKVLQLIGAVAGGQPGEPFADLFDRETLAVWVIAIGVWIFTTGTISDLERLGSPSEPSPGYRPPLPSLRTRFLLGGTVIVAAGALALVDLPALPDPGRAPELGWFWPAALYFGVVLVVLGTIRHQETQLQWRRQNIDVAPEVRTQWWSGVGVVVGIAAVMMLVVPIVRGGRALGYVYDRIIDSVVWAADGLGINIRIGSANSVRREPPDTAAELADQLGIPESGSLISDVIDITTGFVFIVVMAALALAALRLIRGLSLPIAKLGGARVTAGILRALWLAITAIPKLLIWAVTTLAAWLKRIRTATFDTPEPDSGSGMSTERRSKWGEDDPNRRQVGELYRRFLDAAEQELVARKRSETPREYGSTVSDMVPRRDPVDDLTEIFNEARYSLHPIADQDVRRAAGSLESFEEILTDEQSPSSGDE